MAVKEVPEQQRISQMLSNADQRAGFTLVELLAVMTIVALVASLATMMIPGTGRAALKAVTLDTAALLRRERLGAILTGQVRRVLLDGERRIVIGDGGQAVSIPRDIVVDILGVDERRSGRQVVARFEPNGASSGAVLRFSREKASYEIRVNWYTGAVAFVTLDRP
jgi:general secretion pathway protein H